MICDYAKMLLTHLFGEVSKMQTFSCSDTLSSWKERICFVIFLNVEGNKPIS